MKVTQAQLEELRKANLLCEDEEDEEMVVKRDEPKPKFRFNPLDFSQDIPERLPPECLIPYESPQECRKPRIVSQSGYGLCDIPEECPVKVIEYGSTVEIVTSLNWSKNNGLSKIRKLSANEYLNVETGEIKQYKKNENRLQPMSVSKFNASVRELKRLIIGNFSDNEGLFITLAYDYHMPDYTIAQNDYTKFYDKLKYYCKTHLGIEKLLFIKVVEPKASGSWHFHILLKSQDGKPLEISEDWLRKKWKQNSVSVKPITNVKGLALYLGRSTKSSNICDCEYYEEDEDGISIISGKYDPERRKCYKSHMKLYSASQELSRPTEDTMSQEEARNKVKQYKLIDKRYSIVRHKSKFYGSRILNVTNYETYEKND